MIVDHALSAVEWAILQAVKAGDVDENVDLPDDVLAALHNDPSMEKAAGNAEHLKRYWAHGAGAAKIAWGTHGDFARCVAHVGKYMDDPEGYCNLRHKDATGEYPSQHAARERHARKSLSLNEFDLLKREYVRDSHGRFATTAGSASAPTSTGPDRKSLGEGYVPMAPDFHEWSPQLQDAYLEVVTADRYPGEAIDRLGVQATVYGIKHGYMPPHPGDLDATTNDLDVFTRGIQRRALAAYFRNGEDNTTKEFDAAVDDLRTKGHVAIAATPNSALAILGDGRFKTQFESNRSNGMYSPNERAAAEVEMFGHAPNTPAEKRTIYGFVTPPGLTGCQGPIQYGPIRFVLDDSVKARATMTMGDSLSTYAQPMAMTGKVSHDDIAAARNHVRPSSTARFPGDRSWFDREYAEAQVHGGVHLSDVRQVWVPDTDHPLNHAVATMAAEHGIEVIRYPAYGVTESPYAKADTPIYGVRDDGAELRSAPGEAGFGEPMAYIVLDGVAYEPRPLAALVARGDWQPPLRKAVTLVEKYNHAHDQRGRFATHSGMRVGDTKDDAKAQAKLLPAADTMAGLPEDIQAKIHESAASMGVDQAALEANIEGCYQRAVDRTGNPPRGADWYAQANQEALGVANDAGISHGQAVGAIAAISPQMAWAPNLAVARYLAENRDLPMDTRALSETMTKRVGPVGQSKVVTKTRYEWAREEVDGRTIDKQTRTMPPLSALEGKRASDLDPYVAAALLKAHAQAGVGVFEGKRLTGALSVADDITGKVQKVNFPGTVQTGRGLRIIRGEGANEIINGHKVRSFHNNILLPGRANEHDDVTVDSHAVSLALGRKISSSSDEYAAFTGGSRKGSPYTRGPVNATLGVSGDYALWADAYRAVAKRHGLTASQLQSITWIQWRHEHPDNARATHAMD